MRVCAYVLAPLRRHREMGARPPLDEQRHRALLRPGKDSHSSLNYPDCSPCQLKTLPQTNKLFADPTGGWVGGSSRGSSAGASAADSASGHTGQ
jgi:hypothetical protein